MRISTLENTLRAYGSASTWEKAKSTAAALTPNSLYRQMLDFIDVFEDEEYDRELTDQEEFEFLRIFVQVDKYKLYAIEQELHDQICKAVNGENVRIMNSLNKTGLMTIDCYLGCRDRARGVLLIDYFIVLDKLGVLNKPIIDFMQKCSFQFDGYASCAAIGNVTESNLRFSLLSYRKAFAAVIWVYEQNGMLNRILKKPDCESIILNSMLNLINGKQYPILVNAKPEELLQVCKSLKLVTNNRLFSPKASAPEEPSIVNVSNMQLC